LNLEWLSPSFVLPTTFPQPPDNRFTATTPCQYGGYSEKVEQDIYGKWMNAFGDKWASYDGEWKDASVNGAAAAWSVWKARPGNHDHYWESRMPARKGLSQAEYRKRRKWVFGKWYRSSGMVTVLTIPPGTTFFQSM
jgi:hypothetical protein